MQVNVIDSISRAGTIKQNIHSLIIRIQLFSYHKSSLYKAVLCNGTANIWNSALSLINRAAACQEILRKKIK
jgi:hypothetical protein